MVNVSGPVFTAEADAAYEATTALSSIAPPRRAPRNVAKALLQTQGWREGAGLGARGTGRTEALEAQGNAGRAGLGRTARQRAAEAAAEESGGSGVSKRAQRAGEAAVPHAQSVEWLQSDDNAAAVLASLVRDEGLVLHRFDWLTHGLV